MPNIIFKHDQVLQIVTEKCKGPLFVLEVFRPGHGVQESQASGLLKDKEGKEQNMQLPREVIQQLRDVVFGFDTFYVTGVENYQANGVLFKGNLRGRSAAESYTRTAARLKVLFCHC